MGNYLPVKKKHKKILIVIVIIILLMIYSFAWGKEIKSNRVMCNLDEYSFYPKALDQILPSFKIEQGDNRSYYILNDGGIVEAFDTQAIGALQAGLAQYWYPQYLATVIIALDREQSNSTITSWNDLSFVQEEVGILDTPGNLEMLISAMSYGLEGEKYSLNKAIDLLGDLHVNKRLRINSFETPIIICYDYQAANLIDNGRNIEIIVPREGTYTYEKGLLSNQKLDFKGDINGSLLEANLRLINGQNNLSIYYDEIEYEYTSRVKDYKYFAKFTENLNSRIQREVFKSRLYMSIDNLEHLIGALFYIIIVTIWLAFLLHRSMQKGVSYAAFFTGIILVLWTSVRLIKYQVEAIPTFNRYLWYSFYIFQLSLPLVILWMAWAIDKAENEIIPPKRWRAIAIFIGVLIVFVFTNDLHGFVLVLDLSKSDWGVNYSYNFGYYIILFVCMTNLFLAFIILIKKSIKNLRKKGFIFPLIIFILFGIYNYKYITRDSFVYQTDLTILTGVFAMLMFESCIWAGLIPVNTKYIDIFRMSPLKMQIIDKDGQVIIKSRSAIELDNHLLQKLIDSSPTPIIEKESLLFANPIPGGYALWNEDVSKLYKLHKEVKESTEMLIEANAILAEEKEKKSIDDENTKTDLMDQLEREIAGSLKHLSNMIENLPYLEKHSIEVTRIALLLCYIKRRCNFFFQEKEKNTMEIDELVLYIDEFSEIAEHGNIKIKTISEIKGQLLIRYAILFYDFAYLMADLAVEKRCSHSIQNLGIKGDSFNMGFLTSEDLEGIKLDDSFILAVERAKGKISIKDLEDTMGISISFPKGGGKYD